MKAYWYVGEGGLNYGDALVPVIFERLAGVALEWAPASEAELFAIGSNLHLVPPGFAGTVFGLGAMVATRSDLTSARVLALRGELTAALAGVRPPVLADPGLLAADLLPERPAQDIEHGLLRHFGDRRRMAGHRVDVLGGVDHVIAEVARCQRLSSSSLHGLVLADALGIPNRWVPHPPAQPIKFVDYGSSYGEVIRPWAWRLADQAQVVAKRRALLGLLGLV